MFHLPHPVSMSEQQDPLAQFKPAVCAKIKEQSLLLDTRACYCRSWEQLFTREEQESLGGDLDECWNREPNIVRLWMKLRDRSQLRAIVELAHGLNFLTPQDYQWLLREIGEPESPESQTTRPVWDPERRELRFGGKVVRRVHSRNVARSISGILDDFQEAGWPARIPSKLDTTLSFQPLHDAVSRLNKGLAEIRFRVDGGDIIWTRR